MNRGVEFRQCSRLFANRPEFSFEFIEHRNASDALVENATPIVDIDYITDSRHGQSRVLHDAPNLEFIVDPVGWAPIAIKFQNLPIAPRKDFGGATNGNWLGCN